MNVHKFREETPQGVTRYAIFRFWDWRARELVMAAWKIAFTGAGTSEKWTVNVPWFSTGESNRTGSLEFKPQTPKGNLHPIRVETGLAPAGGGWTDDSFDHLLARLEEVGGDVLASYQPFLFIFDELVKAVPHGEDPPAVHRLAQDLEILGDEIRNVKKDLVASSDLAISGSDGSPSIVDCRARSLRDIARAHDLALVWMIQDLSMIRSAVEDLDARLASLERWASGPRARRLVTRPAPPEYKSAAEPADDNELPF